MFVFRCFLLLTFILTSSSSLLVGLVTKDAAIIGSSSVFAKNGVAMREDFDWIRQLSGDCLVGVQGDSSDCEYLLSQLESASRDHELTFGRPLPCRSVAHLCRRIIARFLRSNQLKVSVLVAGWNSDLNQPSLFWLDSIGNMILILSPALESVCVFLFLFSSIAIISHLGAIQEVPYAAHGEGFSFVLGLLDSKNRGNTPNVQIETSVVDRPTLVSSLSSEVRDAMIVVGGTDDSVKRQIVPRGALLQMNLDEGSSTIRSCMNAAKKRSLGSLGTCRIKGVTAGGCLDLGFT